MLGFSLLAQKGNSLRGVVADSTIQLKLPYVTVSVLNSGDSTLKAFTRTALDGTFRINNLKKGKVLLMVTYKGYADYIEQIVLDSSTSDVDLGKINLTLKTRLLKEVIVRGDPIAIKIKGDTTEYNAASFKIRPNSKVEDLLRQLPGIQVDKDGKITAQGQVVNKVLLDGEEFFGDDPTLVTQNIRGDMVDKIQLYDKKSDQAAFTGIDDGKKTKTINVKLKEDKKNGYFGKLEAGIGTNQYYQDQAYFNLFSNKQKLSAYGTISNTGKTGLGWEDNSKLGAGGNIQVSESGGITISGGGDELESFDGRYDGDGYPKAATGGAHYDRKINNDKQSININYKIGSLTVDGERNTLSQNNLPSSVNKS